MPNLPAAAVAAFCTFMLGAPWYSKAMFLRIWGRESGFDLDNPPPRKEGAKHPALTFVISYLAALVAALVLSMVLGPHPELEHAVLTGFEVGAGCVATSFAINYSFASRSWKLWAVDAGYHVVQFSLFGLVLGLWP